MANPRQRKKLKKHKPIKSTKKRKLDLSRAHAIVRENWDHKKSVRQNYMAMGLMASLGGHAGGTGNEQQEFLQEKEHLEKLKSNVELRDLNQVPEPEPFSLDDKLVLDPRALNIGRSLSKRPLHSEIKETPVTRALEAEAALAGPRIRYKSEHEARILEALVSKHGNDYDKMARDVKLNVFQKSAGQLKRKILTLK